MCEPEESGKIEKFCLWRKEIMKPHEKANLCDFLVVVQLDIIVLSTHASFKTRLKRYGRIFDTWKLSTLKLWIFFRGLIILFVGVKSSKDAGRGSEKVLTGGSKKY